MVICMQDDGRVLQIWVDPSVRERWKEDPYWSDIARLVIAGDGKYTVEIRHTQPDQTITLLAAVA